MMVTRLKPLRHMPHAPCICEIRYLRSGTRNIVYLYTRIHSLYTPAWRSSSIKLADFIIWKDEMSQHLVMISYSLLRQKPSFSSHVLLPHLQFLGNTVAFLGLLLLLPLRTLGLNDPY
jgi:hypothetical protein